MIYDRTEQNMFLISKNAIKGLLTTCKYLLCFKPIHSFQNTSF